MKNLNSNEVKEVSGGYRFWRKVALYMLESGVGGQDRYGAGGWRP